MTTPDASFSMTITVFSSSTLTYVKEDVQNEEDAKVNPFTPFCGQSKEVNWETTLKHINFQLYSPSLWL